MVTVQGLPRVTISPSVQRVEIGHHADFNCTYDEDPFPFGNVFWWLIDDYVHENVHHEVMRIYGRDSSWTPNEYRGRVKYVDKGAIRRITGMRITPVKWEDAGWYACGRSLMNEAHSNVYSLLVKLIVYGKYKL